MAEDIIVCAPENCKIKINKWRVREGFPVNLSQVILFYEICDSEDKEIKRLKSDKNGVVKKRLAKEGAVVEKGAPLLELSDCVHTTVMKDMCADCGADLRQNENGNTSEASIPMIHCIPELKVTQKLAQKLGQADTKRLLEDKKLVLLVDLDQTIIHTTNDMVPNNIKGIHHFQLYGPHSPVYHTRLRPGTIQFLVQISEFYELHICTFGARNYAHTIAQFLDPDGKFFSHRILSRDECFNVNSKTDNLKALFPCGDSMVCIIDDREDVWNMAPNLIQVKPYHFFQHTGDINAPPGLEKQELDGKGINFKDLNNVEDASNKETDSCSKETNSDCSNENIDVEKSSDDENSTSQNKTENCIAITENNVIKDEDDLKVTNKEPNSNDDESKVSNEQPNVDVDESKVSNEEPNCNDESKVINEEPNLIDESTPPKSTDSSEDKTVQIEDSTTNILQQKTNEEELSICNNENFENRIEIDLKEIEDPDDYLLYLEEILKTIHKRFYEIHDKTKEMPDLKVLIPKIRSEVLRGQNLVFSGLVPTNMKLEQSRVYLIAKSLGANVSQHITDETTHLVALTAGTFKVNAARKRREVHIVTPDWLWSCAERWEHVSEKLFPLDPNKPSKQRQPPAHCHSPEHFVDYSHKSEICTNFTKEQEEEKFIDTINPLLSFSNDDLDDMNKEFDQFFESDSSSDDEPVDIENPPLKKSLLKRKREVANDIRQREFFSREDENINLSTENIADKNSSEDEDESPSEKFRRGQDLEIGSESNSAEGSEQQVDEEDDCEWNMMGAALEREFLGLED